MFPKEQITLRALVQQYVVDLADTKKPIEDQNGSTLDTLGRIRDGDGGVGGSWFGDSVRRKVDAGWGGVELEAEVVGVGGDCLRGVYDFTT
uniref:Uncharacterized protein n=1 Tax=Medicago truncatula TaxID=3880 RepID=A2Q1U9_MEDTR|nr:hypothetical protein MtrDRAFT_AC149129g32v2 [Medicago truncatula]